MHVLKAGADKVLDVENIANAGDDVDAEEVTHAEDFVAVTADVVVTEDAIDQHAYHRVDAVVPVLDVVIPLKMAGNVPAVLDVSIVSSMAVAIDLVITMNEGSIIGVTAANNEPALTDVVRVMHAIIKSIDCFLIASMLLVKANALEVISEINEDYYRVVDG